MILKSFARGLHRVANLVSGESGWINLTDQQALSSYGLTSNAGTMVSGESAMTLSAVWDAVRKTSQTVGSTPLAQYERDSSGNPNVVEDDLHSILTMQPAPGITPSHFWTGQVVQILLRGNAYNERLEVGRNRRLVGLRPLFGVTPKLQDDGTFRYSIVDRGKRYELPPEKVFHIRGFGAGDGLGMSAIKYGTQSMGAALAADQSAQKVFANTMMLAGVLSSDQTLKPEQREQAQAMLETFVGSSKAGKTMVLEAGLTWSAMQLNPDDAQLLETRKFSVEDVCRWFGIPPVVIGHASAGQTMFGAGVEQVMLSWQKLGIGPIYRAIEDQIRMDLISPERRARRSFRFDRQWMLAMDSAALGDFLLKLRMGGFISGDEGRAEWLALPRRGDEADDLIVSSAMSPVDMLGKDTRT